MYRFWSFLFALVPILATAFCFWSPSQGWWFPENISSFGGEIDDLFNLILYITGVTFVLCNALLVFFMWRYAEKPGEENSKAVYSHGSHKLEVFWTTATALMLAYIAFGQMGIWMRVKFPNSSKDLPTIARVTARQFEWRMTYPGADGTFGTIDDVEVNSELVVPVNRPVKIMLRSDDVLHSFFLPNLRVKQDAVPGMSIPIWFKAEKAGTYDLVCAELCGWGHYKMKGRLRVLTKKKYDEWLAATTADALGVEEE